MISPMISGQLPAPKGHRGQLPAPKGHRGQLPAPKGHCRHFQRHCDQLPAPKGVLMIFYPKLVLFRRVSAPQVVFAFLRFRVCLF